MGIKFRGVVPDEARRQATLQFAISISDQALAEERVPNNEAGPFMTAAAGTATARLIFHAGWADHEQAVGLAMQTYEHFLRMTLNKMADVRAVLMAPEGEA